MGIFGWIVTGVLLTQSAYLFIFALAGKIKPYKALKKPLEGPPYPSFGVIIPSFKAGAVVAKSVEMVLKADYPLEKIGIYVVSSGEALPNLPKHPSLLSLEFPKERLIKVEGLRTAYKNFRQPYDYVVVLDADNHISENLFKVATHYLMHKSPVLQVQRRPKNEEFPFALLDGMSESINNHIFRKGHQALGLPPALSGSGMVFTDAVFKKYVLPITAKIGFDKDLELRLLSQSVPIRYTETAYVLDEKVDDLKVFKSQRLNWLSAQYHFGFYNLSNAFRALFSGKIGYADKVLQFLMLPRLLLLFGTLIWALVGLFWGTPTNIPAYVSPLITIGLALILALEPRYITFNNLATLGRLPRLFFVLLATLFKIKGPKADFTPTPHKVKDPKAIKK